MDTTMTGIDPEELRRNLAITLGGQQPQLANLREPQMAPPPPSQPMPDNRYNLALNTPQAKVIAPRGTLQGDLAERSRLMSTGSGISQIGQKIQNSRLGESHPMLGKILGGLAQGAATIGDVALNTAGGGFGHLAAMQIPGTAEHHALELHQANNAVGQDEAAAEKEAETAAQNAEIPLRQAQTHEAEARAGALENPAEKPDKYSFQQTDHGLMRIDNVTGEATPVTFQGQTLQPKSPAAKEIGPKEDLQNQILDASEKGDTAQVKALQDRLRAIDPIAADRLQITIRGQNLAGDRSASNVSRQDIREHDKAYVQPAETTEKSYQMMDHAYQEYQAAKKAGRELPTGAQSMLALSTHLSTTFGNVKGARVTKDMIEHHLGARSISDSALVAVQKLTNGDTLSPAQWDAFHDLIKQSRNLSWSTAVKEAARKHIPIDFLPPDLQTINKGGVKYTIGDDGQYHKAGE